MKTWKMMKELTEKPHKKYKLTQCEDMNKCGVIVKNHKGYLMFVDHEDIQVLNVLPLIIPNNEWEEVRHAVMWIEAFQKGLEGKRIKPALQHFSFPDYRTLSQTLKYLEERQDYYEEILKQGWFIED